MCFPQEVKCNCIYLHKTEDAKGLKLVGDDDDMDFQDAKSSDTSCSYKPLDLHYMGRKRLEDTEKIQWFDGQKLNYDPF